MEEKNKKNNNGPKINLTWIYVIIAGILGYLVLTSDNKTAVMGGSSKSVAYGEFKTYVENGYAQRIIANKDDGELQMYVDAEHIRDVFKNMPVERGRVPYVETEYPSNDKLDEFLADQQELGNFNGDVTYKKNSSLFGNFLWSFGPLIFLLFMWMFVMRRMGGGGSGGGPMGIFNVGKSRARLVEKDHVGRVTFADVAGQAGAKQEVQEIVEFLKNPKKFTELGGKIPKGALLVGPPGTGKTLLAKAVAGEADVPFFSMSGSDFVEMFVGVGASRVRDLFSQAKEKSPCIIFIDEIDAVGRARSKGAAMGGNDERESTLNQLLTEMDGFGTNSGVIILAATNRADVLDKALLRPGRFDRQVHVGLPDIKGREEILKVHLRKLPSTVGVDVNALARGTPGFSGAQIANLVNEAALFAARRNKTSVDMNDFEDAKDKLFMGPERKSMVLREEERRATAYHEAGHALVAEMLPGTDPVHKVTIMPRGWALGVTWQLPEFDQTSLDKSKMLNDIAILFGGRIAEEVFVNQKTTGASNDFERATKMARAMVTKYGMSSKLTNMTFDNEGNEVFIGRSFGSTRNYSEDTASIIDEEVKTIIDEAYAKVKEILTENMDKLNRIADVLMEKEKIDGEEFAQIFGD